MVRVRIKLRPLVGFPRAELAEVWPAAACSALRGPAEGAFPTAAPGHAFPERHRQRGEADVRAEQPERPLQALRGEAALL